MISNVDPSFDLIYGDVDESLVFLPRIRAIELADTQAALWGAATWGELRCRMPAPAYREFLAQLEGHDLLDFDTFFEEQRKEEPQLSEAVARTHYLALAPFEERQPEDADPFEAGNIGFVCDGDFPGWPAQEMLAWVPKLIQERFGKRGDSRVSGPCLLFDPADEKELVEVFARAGFRCTRDNELLHRAYGG